MKFVFETVAETQNASLEAAGILTDNLLAAIERLVQLNIEASRSVFEHSAELTLVCLKTDNPFAWHRLKRLSEA